MPFDVEKMEIAVEALRACAVSASKHDPDAIYHFSPERARNAVASIVEGARLHPRIVETARAIGFDPHDYADLIFDMIKDKRKSMPKNFLDPDYDHGDWTTPRPAPVLKVVNSPDETKG